MALRLEDHVFRMLENQDALYNLLGEHRWDFDMDAGTIVFSTEAGGGLLGRFFSEPPKVLATCPIQLIGSESEADDTWLWAWANAQSRIPSELTRGVAQIRDEARALGGLELFFDPRPVPRPSPRFGTELAIICTGHLGLFAYYSCPHPGGLLHVAIAEPPAGIEIERSAMQATRIMHIGMSALEFDHRRAIAAYLGEPARADGDALEWHVGGMTLRVEFDDQGRSARMTTSVGETT
jgi:hypothetical protein